MIRNSNNSEQAEKNIVIALLVGARDGDISPYRIAIDEFGLAPSHFYHMGLRRMFTAAMETYAVSAPQDKSPGLSDVMVRLEGAGFSVEQLEKLHTSVLGAGTSDTRTAARMVVGRSLAELASDAIKHFQKKIKNPLAVPGAMAGLAELLLTAAERGGAQESRPDVIMSEFWDKEFKGAVSTGIRALDRAVAGDNMVGGFEAGELWIVGAPSGHGKSALTCHLAVEQARQNRGSVIHSFEMARESLITRMLCNLGAIPMSSVMNPAAANRDERDSLDAAIRTLGTLVRVYDKHCTIDDLALRIRRHKVEFGSSHILHVLDHFGQLDVGDDWRDSQKAIYALKRLALEQSICLLVFSQVDDRTRRELIDTNRTTNAEYYGSRSIKQAADVGAFIVKHNGIANGGAEYDTTTHNATCYQISKVRKTGRQSYFGLRYRPEWYKYESESLWFEQ